MPSTPAWIGRRSTPVSQRASSPRKSPRAWSTKADTSYHRRFAGRSRWNWRHRADPSALDQHRRCIRGCGPRCFDQRLCICRHYKLTYAGRQFGYCFYLATLTSTHVPTSLDEARDRVGVLSIFVMWAVYDQIKPVRTNTRMREAVAGVVGALQKGRPLRDASCSPEDKLKELAKIRSTFGKAVQALR